MNFDAKAYQKQYMKDHAEQMRGYRKAWELRNPEKVRAKWRRQSPRYQARHKEELRERAKKYYRRNREHILEQVRAYHAINRERDNARVKQWNTLHPHKSTQYNLKRRALESKAAVNLEALKAYVARIRNKHDCHCYYCKDLVDGRRVHFDHIIPLAKGGSHAVENLCVTCPACNRSKHATLLLTWAKHPQLFFNF